MKVKGIPDFGDAELVLKGVANKSRITMLALLERRANMGLTDIAEELGMNIKTAAEHLRRLMLAGLITKEHHGRQVEHALTHTGEQALAFLKRIDHK